MKKPSTILPPPKPKRDLHFSKRFPNDYTHKTKIWIPARPPVESALVFGGGGGSATIEVSGCLPDKAAELLMWLVFEGKRATDAELTVIIAAAKVAANRIRAEREAERKAKDV